MVADAFGRCQCTFQIGVLIKDRVEEFAKVHTNGKVITITHREAEQLHCFNGSLRYVIGSLR